MTLKVRTDVSRGMRYPVNYIVYKGVRYNEATHENTIFSLLGKLTEVVEDFELRKLHHSRCRSRIRVDWVCDCMDPVHYSAEACELRAITVLRELRPTLEKLGLLEER